jgi:hypothetical protein
MFVVFHTQFPHQDKRYFVTKAGAKRSATCSNRNAGKEVYRMLSEQDFNELYPVKIKVVKNLMTGEDVEITENTPWCCNPASETYWSM